MVRTFVSCCLLVIALARFSHASVLNDLALPRGYSSHRESSYDRWGGNGDGGQGNPVKPGEVREIASLKGPGRIAHVWFTLAPFDKDLLQNVILRTYWDGEASPSVEAPIGAFFGLGHGKEASFDSLPISVGNNRGLNCFFPMPFAKSARITIENQSKSTLAALYYYIDYQRDNVLPKPILYFHAEYRQSKPALEPGNYIALSAQGSGHYVGMFYYIRSNSPGWWGEGDDVIVIDGSRKLLGTGMEDYFCNAWGMKDGQTFQRFGAPLFEVYKTGWGNENTAYRWHLEDAIAFSKSISVTHEHGSNNDRNDDFSSVAFWYQTHPRAPFPKLGTPFERMATGERQAALTASGDIAGLRRMLGNIASTAVDVEMKTKAVLDLAAAEIANKNLDAASRTLARYQGRVPVRGLTDKAAEFAAANGIPFSKPASDSVWLLPCGDGRVSLTGDKRFATARDSGSAYLYFAASETSSSPRDLRLHIDCELIGRGRLLVEYQTENSSHTPITVKTGKVSSFSIALPRALLNKSQNCSSDFRLSAPGGDLIVRSVTLQ